MGEPHTMNRRLIAQSGTFAVPGVLDVPIEEILSDADQENILAKIVLTNPVREVGMRELYRMNITYATLFPDLDGLAQSMRLRAGVPLGVQPADDGAVPHIILRSSDRELRRLGHEGLFIRASIYSGRFAHSVGRTRSAPGRGETTSAIGGQVNDPTGAAVGGATVTATNDQTGLKRQAQTDRRGPLRVSPDQARTIHPDVECARFRGTGQQARFRGAWRNRDRDLHAETRRGQSRTSPSWARRR